MKSYSQEREPILPKPVEIRTASNTVLSCPHPTEKNDRYCLHYLYMSVLFSGLLVIYILDIYFSNQIETLILSMWLSVNGLVGIYLLVNALTIWLSFIYPLICNKSYISCSNVIFILGAIFTTTFTIVGWYYFSQYPHSYTIKESFYTFMWARLIIQSILSIFYVLFSFYV